MKNKHIDDGSCSDCGIKGHDVIIEDGFEVTECSKCGKEISCFEMDYEPDWDAIAKDDAIDRNGDY